MITVGIYGMLVAIENDIMFMCEKHFANLQFYNVLFWLVYQQNCESVQGKVKHIETLTLQAGYFYNLYSIGMISIKFTLMYYSVVEV